MKAGLSISILALIQNVSATDLKSLARSKSNNLLHHKTNHKMYDEAKEWNNFFQKSGQEAVQIQDQANAYYDKLDKEAEDNQSFEFVQLKNQVRDHDNDTEDIPYNLDPSGFYATSKEIDEEKSTLQSAVQAQSKTLIKAESQTKQKDAHSNDTEDVPEAPEALEVYNKPNWFVQTQARFNHENDTEDVPNDPYIDSNLNYIEPPTELELLSTSTGLRWTHENDTEDLPEGQDPVGFVQLKKHKLRRNHNNRHMPKHHNYLQIHDTNEVNHEKDTDDVGYEEKVSNAYESYDIHHTKEWNEKVNQQALAIENQLQTETEEENERKLAQREAQQEQEERKQISLQQLEQKKHYEAAMADGHQHLGQTDSQVYGFFENEINAGAQNNKVYQHHSNYWNSKIEEQTNEIGQQMAQEDEQEEQHEHMAQANVHPQTIDLNDVYENMNIQTGYEHHSKFWKAQVKAAEDQLDKDFKAQDEAEEFAKVHKNDGQILAQGMTPVDLYVHHPNPSVDFNIYDGVTLLQLGDHDNDEDDIVPELNSAVQAPQALAQKDEQLKSDFAGEKFKEVYDD